MVVNRGLVDASYMERRRSPYRPHLIVTGWVVAGVALVYISTAQSQARSPDACIDWACWSDPGEMAILVGIFIGMPVWVISTFAVGITQVICGAGSKAAATAGWVAPPVVVAVGAFAIEAAFSVG